MEFKQVIENRKTNKDYTGEIVSDAVINDIIALAEQAPSSFGSETWEVLIVKNEGKGRDLLDKVKPLMWSQPNLTTASHVFFVFYRNRMNFVAGSEYTKKIAQKYDKAGANGQAIVDAMLNHIHTFESDINAWSRQQTYILLANILLAATSKGLGSTPMEGLEFPRVEKVFREEGIIDDEYLNLGVVASIGVGNGSTFDRLRFDTNEKFVKYN